MTIPVAVLDRLGLRAGDELEVQAENGRITLEPALPLADRRMQALERIGDKYAGLYPPGYLEELRREWRA